MFDTPAIRNAAPLLVLRKLCLLVVGAYLVVGLTAGYRAYHQIKSVNLQAPQQLYPGSSIATSVTTYGRTFINVKLELIQGEQVEVLSAYRITNNPWPFLDPRTRRDLNDTLVTGEALRKYHRGPAMVRATATGGPQLGHVPPPMIREVVVEIPPN